MSSIAPDLGDAVRPDGTLKDASEIIWSYDADDSIPFPLDSLFGTRPASSCGPAPAMMVAGARWTTHTHRPSQRALEVAEAASSSSASAHPGSKRKAPSDPIPDRRVTRKIIYDLDEEVADPSDGGATTEPAEDDYESIKAMADADNLVRSSPSLLNCVLTYF